MVIWSREKKLSFTVNVLAIAIPVLVATLLGMNRTDQKLDLGDWTKFLPHFIGLINTLTSLVLIMALVAIKKGAQLLHKRLIYVAISLGAVFLLTYVTYHLSNTSVMFGDIDHNGALSDSEKTQLGFMRPVYLTLLISHITLSIVVVWFVLQALKYAMLGDFKTHKKAVKIAYPVWLYVSVTGVFVYLLIRDYYV